MVMSFEHTYLKTSYLSSDENKQIIVHFRWQILSAFLTLAGMDPKLVLVLQHSEAKSNQKRQSRRTRHQNKIKSHGKLRYLWKKKNKLWRDIEQPIDWDQKSHQIRTVLKGQKKKSFWRRKLMDEALQWIGNLKVNENKKEMQLRKLNTIKEQDKEIKIKEKDKEKLYPEGLRSKKEELKGWHKKRKWISHCWFGNIAVSRCKEISIRNGNNYVVVC